LIRLCSHLFPPLRCVRAQQLEVPWQRSFASASEPLACPQSPPAAATAALLGTRATTGAASAAASAAAAEKNFLAVHCPEPTAVVLETLAKVHRRHFTSLC